MDIATKYRTKNPPREHEEAVKMLLEGIQPKQQQEHRQHSTQSGAKINSNGTNSYEDGRSLVSTSDSNKAPPSMRSKATSTTSDSNSSESVDPIGRCNPIPSRTIAVQCELKSSSMRRDDQVDTSMQASSISSTRYGFYNYSLETLENRRRLEKLAAEINENRTMKLKTQENSQIEAPTSMSELSSSSSCLSSTASEIEGVTKYRTKQRGRNETPSLSSSSEVLYRKSPSSMPQRPKTALSYVSSTQLKNGQQEEHASSDDDIRFDRGQQRRAISHQSLTRPLTPMARAAVESIRSNGGSDGEQSAGRPSFERDDYQVPCSEEVVLTKRGHFVVPNGSVANKPPRPTLISSAHNEQVRDYLTLERIPMTRVTPSRQDPDNYMQQQPNEFKKSHSRFTLSTALSDRNGLQEKENQLIEPLDYERFNYHNSDVSGNHQSMDGARLNATLTNGQRLNSMSLSRRQRTPMMSNIAYGNHDRKFADSNSYQASVSRRPATLSRNDRAFSQTLLSKPTASTIYDYNRSQAVRPSNEAADVCRSTSMRHISRLGEHYEPYRKNNDEVFKAEQRQNSSTAYASTRAFRVEGQGRDDSEDSESPLTKTWTSPDRAKGKAQVQQQRQAAPGFSSTQDQQLFVSAANRKSAGRSFSMRDINRTTENMDGQVHHDFSYNTASRRNNLAANYSSSSEASSVENDRHRFVRSHRLDYDSQHRLNQSGLPDPKEAPSSSYLSLTSHRLRDSSNLISPFSSSASNSRLLLGGSHSHSNNGAITGRAMSQQSLIRPTMPMSVGRRRRSGGSNSGSDVGGSSMSLVSRLQGRYENAHTRSPIVMYIPPTIPKSSSSSLGLGSRKLSSSNSINRKSLRSSATKQKSSLRNGSDSESSSSMLRTLVRPRNRGNNQFGSKRIARGQNVPMIHDHDGVDGGEEYMDGIGQLASEVDSYKFRRRYSVPKDAKINWFAKLKQRVSASSK